MSARPIAMLLLILASPSTAAAPRRLSLRDAISLALGTDPLVGEARTAGDRAHLTWLRAELDRVSVKVDAQLQQLWTRGGFGATEAPPSSLADATAAAGGAPDSAAVGLFNVAANVGVPLFAGFRIDATVKRAAIGREAAQAQLGQAQHDVTLAVARAYWAMRRQSLVLEAQASALTRLGDAAEVVAARVRMGLAPPIDLNRATVRRLQQQSTIASLEGQVAEAKAQLAVLLGLGDADVELVDSPRTIELPATDVDTLLARATRHRPELRSADAQRRMQEQTVRIAASTWYPQLTVFGLFQYGNNPYSTAQGAHVPLSAALNPFSNLSGNLTLGATLTLNIFDTLNTFTSVRDARYELARLEEEERRSARVVETEVRQAWARLNRLVQQQAALVTAQKMAHDTVAIIDSRYRHGDALVIEYLDAQVDLANIEQQLADLRSQVELTRLELDAATGQRLGGL